MNSAFCNPYDRAINQNHDQCPGLMPTGVDVGKDGATTTKAPTQCECSCHVRHAAVWMDWMGEAQTQEGFRLAEDATLSINLLKRLELIPADSETDVIEYVGEVPW